MSNTRFWTCASILSLTVLAGLSIASKYFGNAEPKAAVAASLQQGVDDPTEAVSRNVVEGVSRDARVLLHAEAHESRLTTVEHMTGERLKDTSVPQTIHGTLLGYEEHERKLGPGEKSLRIYARASDGRTLSSSAILKGKYSLGPLPAGEHILFMAERERVPGLVIQVRVNANQEAQEIEFGLGECDLVITVLDQRGNILLSDAVELSVGGTDPERHTFKRAKGTQNGTWEIRELLPGEYLASAKLGDHHGGALLTLAPGRNVCTLRVGP